MITGGELFALDAELAAYTVPVEDGSAIRPEGVSTAVVLKPTLIYDPATDTFKNIETGVVYSDNSKGSYVAPDGVELEPGWRTFIGFDNLAAVFNDPLVRGPFFRTFIWTIVFALVGGLPLLRDRPVPRDHARQAGDAVPAGRTARCSSSPTRSPAS